MRKYILPILLLLAILPAFGTVTTIIRDNYVTQYDTHQHFVAGSTDYAVSETFGSFPVGTKYLIVTVTTPDSTNNTGATPAKYLVATTQFSRDNSTWNNGTTYYWKQLCLSPILAANADATTAFPYTNAGQSSTFIVDLSAKSSCPYIRIKYDVYVAGTRKTDVLTGGSVKTTITAIP